MAFRGPHVDFSSFPKELLEILMAFGAGDPVLPPVPPAAFPSLPAPGAAERRKQSPGRTRAQPLPARRPSHGADASRRPAGTRAAGPPQTQGEQPAGRRVAAERRPKAQRHPADEAAPNAAPHGKAPRNPAGPRPDPAAPHPDGRHADQHSAALGPARACRHPPQRSAPVRPRRRVHLKARPGPAARPPAAPRHPRPAAALPWCTARRRPWRGARPRCGGRTGGGGRMLRRRRGAPCCCYLAGCGAPLCALWERGGRAALPPTGWRAAECGAPREPRPARPGPARPRSRLRRGGRAACPSPALPAARSWAQYRPARKQNAEELWAQSGARSSELRG